MATPNDLLRFQANVRDNLDRFCDAALLSDDKNIDARQLLSCVAVELIMRAGVILGAAANCPNPRDGLKPIDEALREYQRLADRNGGYHLTIVEVDSERGQQ